MWTIVEPRSVDFAREMQQNPDLIAQRDNEFGLRQHHGTLPNARSMPQRFISFIHSSCRVPFQQLLDAGTLDVYARAIAPARSAVRLARPERAKGFAAAAVLTMAVGVGGTSAMLRSSRACCYARFPFQTRTVWSSRGKRSRRQARRPAPGVPSSTPPLARVDARRGGRRELLRDVA